MIHLLVAKTSRHSAASATAPRTLHRDNRDIAGTTTFLAAQTQVAAEYWREATESRRRKIYFSQTH